jgi:hypothetical protein
MFLGSILITYHNETVADTFGSGAVVPVTWELVDLDGNRELHTGDTVTGDIARKIRDRKISRIDIDLRVTS